MRNLSIIGCILFPSASWKCLLCNSFISGKREGDKNKLALCGGWRLADLCEEFFGWEDVMSSFASCLLAFQCFVHAIAAVAVLRRWPLH